MNKSIIHLSAIILLFISSHLLAEPIGNKDGYLQPFTYQQIDRNIHNYLKQQIKIDNPQFYSADESHKHYTWDCSKSQSHRHVGPRNHDHQGYSSTQHTRCSGFIGIQQSVEAAEPKTIVKTIIDASRASTTNVRELGVDEADFVKTDGHYLYSVINSRTSRGIRIYDTHHQGKYFKQIATIDLGKGFVVTGIYLLPQQQRLIAITHGGNTVRSGDNSWYGSTNLFFIDISNKKRPQISRKINLEGKHSFSRRIDNTLYLITSRHYFSLPSTHKHIETIKPLTSTQLAAEKQKIIKNIEKWTIKDLLPHYQEEGKEGTYSLIDANDLYMVPKDKVQNELTSLLAIDLAAPGFKFKSLAWLGEAETIYASTKALYVTEHDYQGKLELNTRQYPKSMTRTIIHKFAFQGKGLGYRGSGAVLGKMEWGTLSTFQLDESRNGQLRVVSSNHRKPRFQLFSTPATRSPVVLTVLAEHPNNKQLITLARLPNNESPDALGKPNETLYGVRLFDDFAYFVTFKRTDPLYVVDLRNPKKLKVTGELIIPGFSDYLHPLGNGLLLGVGKEAEESTDGNWAELKGLKLSLFDISNPNQPREVHKVEIGERGSSSPANRHHHAFTSLSMQNTPITRVAIPMNVVTHKSNQHTRQNGLHRFEVDRTKKSSNILAQ